MSPPERKEGYFSITRHAIDRIANANKFPLKQQITQTHKQTAVFVYPRTRAL